MAQVDVRGRGRPSVPSASPIAPLSAEENARLLAQIGKDSGPSRLPNALPVPRKRFGCLTKVRGWRDRVEERLWQWLLVAVPTLRPGKWEARNWYERLYKPGNAGNFIASHVLLSSLCSLVGAMFYFALSLKLVTDPQRIGVYVSLGTQILTGLVLCLRRVRIAFFLALPSLMSSKLRALLVLTIVAWAFQYPALNIVSNVRATAESVACVQETVRSVAEEVRENANRKMQELPLAQTRNLVENLADSYREMTQTLRELSEDVLKLLQWQMLMARKLMKLLTQCDELARYPYYYCTSAVNDLYNGCLDRYFETLCEPIRQMKTACYASRLAVSACELPGRLKQSAMEGFDAYLRSYLDETLAWTRNTTLFRLVRKGKDAAKDVELTYETLNFTVDYNYTVEHRMNLRLAEFRDLLRKDVAAVEAVLRFCGVLSGYLMFPVMLWPFFAAVYYMMKFNRSDRHDNCYLTSVVDEIDEYRRKNRLKTVFPLNAAEQKLFFRAHARRLSMREKQGLGLRVVMLVFGCVLPALFVLTDIFTYSVLREGYDFFSSNETVVPRPNIYELKVTGTGFLSKFLSHILEVFQPVGKLTDEQDNEWRLCFHEPMAPNYTMFWVMLAMFVVAFILVFVDAYMKRLRHVIAEHYFPQRKWPRARNVVHQIMERRNEILVKTLKKAAGRIARLRREAKAKAQRKLEQGEPEPELEAHLPVRVNQCARCARDDLSLTAAGNTRICVFCQVLYCVDCFSVKRTCMECGEGLDKAAVSTTFVVDSSCSEEEHTVENP